MNGTDKDVSLDWRRIETMVGCTSLFQLLSEGGSVRIEPDLVDAFELLLRILGDERSWETHVHNGDLMDRVIILAEFFDLKEISESIALRLVEQEEERITKRQCLRCGIDHPLFELVLCELCDSCNQRIPQNYDIGTSQCNADCQLVVLQLNSRFGEGLGEAISF